MKKTFVIIALFVSVMAVRAQEYLTKKDINYYSEAICISDSYIKRKCVLDVYYPIEGKSLGTIIWFHGGGLTMGKTEIPDALKGHGYIVVGVDYRLSPKVKAPAYIEDAAAATAWVFNHITEFGGSTNSIFISGHSAGGYLALMITLDKSYLHKYQIDANNIAGIIPMSGQAISHFTIRKENGIEPLQPTIDKYAPLYFVRADAPPMLLITGDRKLELYGRYEENAYLARMMKLVGNKSTTLYELQGFDHGMTIPAFPLLLKFVKKNKL
ncbi:alpha/beta hydrolase [Flavobacterium notoginsengisoli]|uniref:alpha/beta hydrolase n=1 Tax=Flavobacterium notoginsengisoli TaxID=1478199 RepID=UPI0036291422